MSIKTNIEIQLSPKWYLLGSNRQWMLSEKVLRKGVTEYKHRYFFTELEHLLKLYVEIGLRNQSNVNSLTELLENQKVFLERLSTRVPTLNGVEV